MAGLPPRNDQAAVTVFVVAPRPSVLGLFLLPGGRPRRLISVIHAGGRPRRLPRPRAKRSRVRMASSMCSRSWRSSANIFVTSIRCGFSPKSSFQPALRSEKRTECLLQQRTDNVVVRYFGRDFNRPVRKTEQNTIVHVRFYAILRPLPYQYPFVSAKQNRMAGPNR